MTNLDYEPDWECGSCGALIDLEVAEPGDLYHLPDEDCRSVREYVPDLNVEGDPTLNGAFG